ncbi:MAG: T9SS type A sorting domain-containing protein, partial [candidate division WOR-3 bacterium]
EAYIHEKMRCELPHRSLPLRQGNAILVDSSGNPFSAWTQIQECFSFNPTLGYLQFVNRGYFSTGDLYVHQTDADFSFWVHDYVYDYSLYGSARYPASIASSNGPHIGFSIIDPGTGGPPTMMGGSYELGGWFSSCWDPAIDMSGCITALRSIGYQLPTGNILFVSNTSNNWSIPYFTMSLDLGSTLANGSLAANCELWGIDCNGGICYVFYYDIATLNVYYRTTTDGINWSPETQWDITYPTPYANNYLDWTQMALTDAGDPILVFDIADADDSEYPQRHKVYVQIDDGATPIQVSDDFYQASWYPTIATGENYVGNNIVVLFHVWTNNETDSLARNDIFQVFSVDNGVTWSQPYNLTQTFPNRPGLAQLAKRLNASDFQMYYFYAVNMVVDLDIMWAILTGNDHRLDYTAWYVCWDLTYAPGVEENKESPAVQKLNLEIYPNPFSNRTKIRYIIQDAGYTIEEISMNIYDAAGRLVKSFPRSTLDALRRTHITWQGDDDFGRPVPAGVYFVQLKDGKISLGKKIIKLE